MNNMQQSRVTDGRKRTPAVAIAAVLVLSALLATPGHAALSGPNALVVVHSAITPIMLGPAPVVLHIMVPGKPVPRSPFRPPDWVPGPPPWQPGKPDWVPGPPPWVQTR